jgi:hypothetical protein
MGETTGGCIYLRKRKTRPKTPRVRVIDLQFFQSSTRRLDILIQSCLCSRTTQNESQ